MLKPLDKGKPTTVLVDFDGVIHDYSSGWTGPVPTGRLLPGARAALKKLKAAGAEIVVYSTRPERFIRAFLDVHGLVDLVDDVKDGKPYYVAFFDDRAHHVMPSRRNGFLRAVERWLGTKSARRGL